MFQLHNLIADAVDGFCRQANEVGWANLLDVAAAGNLAIEVEFIPAHESYCGWNPDTILARFIADDRPYCWDGCDNILRFHRAGWCRTNPNHADVCACGEQDYDPYEDEIADALAGHP